MGLGLAALRHRPTVEQALYLHMIKSSAEFLLNSITDLIDKWEIQTDTFSALANQPG